MFIRFFLALRQAGIPVSITELLALLEAIREDLAKRRVETFYYLARLILVKDEMWFDRFDQVFAAEFKGLASENLDLFEEIPAAWLQKQMEKWLSDEEKRQIKAFGGWDKLMETLKKRLQEQDSEHHGGSKWIGTGGTSPFGAFGYHPEGIRIGQPQSRQRRAVKVWDRREFRNLDDRVELNTRNIKLALRRLRRFARQGQPEILDLENTIRSTASNAGYLDLKLIPERHNAIKVLLLLDVGGSMDDHVRVCEELFSAACAEFKHLEYYYFHNLPYERLWQDNQRSQKELTATAELIHRYPGDYKLVIVGDASMSPYEILYPGGSVEHWNAEPGAAWMQRLLSAFHHAVWLNPQPQEHWQYHQSNGMIRELMTERMFPLTLSGIDQAIQSLLQTSVHEQQ